MYLQVLSNGRYRSVLHRAMVSSSRARIYIPTFYFPSLDAIIAPATPLTRTEHPTLFRNRQLQGNSCLQYFSCHYKEYPAHETYHSPLELNDGQGDASAEEEFDI